MKIRYLFAAIVACTLVLGALPARAEKEAGKGKDVGRVVSLEPQVFVKRKAQGEDTELTLKAPLFLNDLVRTTATGSVNILLKDETTLALSPNSSAYVERFLFEKGPNDRFSMHLTSGAARMVTGLIVKKNPDAFQVETPQASIGIRGTDCTVAIVGGTTKIVANRITSNNIVVTNMITGEKTDLDKTGFVVEVSGTVNVPQRQATKEELVLITTP